jgi:D-aspartate ligase
VSHRGAVVVGGYVNALGAVRGLGAAGVPIAVVRTKPYDIAHHSRFASEHHELFELHIRPEALIELLERQAGRWTGWAILPTNDHALSVLARHSDHLARWYPPTVPPWDVTRCLVDKSFTYRIAREVGVDVPHAYGPALRRVAADASIRFPVIVKPLESHLFRQRFETKLFVERSRDELLQAVGAVEEAGIRAEIHDLVPGPDSACHNHSVYVDRRGDPAAECAYRKLRKGPPFSGVGRAAESWDSDELREPTLEILRRIGWRGIATAEYKRDPRDGRWRLIEINGRCFLTHGLCRRAGVDFPLLAWRESVLGEPVRAEPNGWQGVWVHLHADLYHTVAARGREDLTLREILSTYRRPKAYAVWSRSDPKPFWAQWSGSFRRHARAGGAA